MTGLDGPPDFERLPIERRPNALRTALGLTQVAMADRLGMSVRQVKRWEAGTVPSEESAHALVALAPRKWRLNPDLFWEPRDKRLEAIAELRALVERLEARVARLERTRR